MYRSLPFIEAVPPSSSSVALPFLFWCASSNFFRNPFASYQWLSQLLLVIVACFSGFSKAQQFLWSFQKLNSQEAKYCKRTFPEVSPPNPRLLLRATYVRMIRRYFTAFSNMFLERYIFLAHPHKSSICAKKPSLRKEKRMLLMLLWIIILNFHCCCFKIDFFDFVFGRRYDGYLEIGVEEGKN